MWSVIWLGHTQASYGGPILFVIGFKIYSVDSDLIRSQASYCGPILFAYSVDMQCDLIRSQSEKAS
jgi:hypothetical protein